MQRVVDDDDGGIFELTFLQLHHVVDFIFRFSCQCYLLCRCLGCYNLFDLNLIIVSILLANSRTIQKTK